MRERKNKEKQIKIILDIIFIILAIVFLVLLQSSNNLVINVLAAFLFLFAVYDLYILLKKKKSE